MIKKFLIRWGPVILWMGLIFGLSAQPDFRNVPYIDFAQSDKLVHMIVYGVLGAVIWRALGSSRPKWWRIAATFALATVYGLTDELHQLHVPGRQFDLLDLGADALGSAIAAVVLTTWLGGEESGYRRRARANLRSERQETHKR